MIQEDVIDKISFLMSISILNQIICSQAIQTDFVTFGTKPEFIKVVLTKLEQKRES